MALFQGWCHQFKTKQETLSCLEERDKETAFIREREPWLGAGGTCERGLRASAR